MVLSDREVVHVLAHKFVATCLELDRARAELSQASKTIAALVEEKKQMAMEVQNAKSYRPLA